MGTFQIFYYEGFNDGALGVDANPLRKKFDSIVDDLKENRHTKLGDVKLIKGDGGVKYFRAKLSDADRLLFSFIKYDGKAGFVLLEVILNHEYNKSKFLKDKEKIKIIKIKYNECCKEVSSNIEMTEVPIRWLGKFITFSVKQEDIVENSGGKYKLPLVVSGHAGSGKTSVALEKLRKIEEELEEGKILYITQSENLIKQSKELYEYEYWDEASNQLRIGVSEQIDFLSVHGFLEKVTKDVAGKKAIDRNVFFSWFEGLCNQAKYKKFKKDVDKLFEEFTAVIAGGGLGRECRNEQYMKLGKRQSIFSEDVRSNVYDIFDEYKKFVKGSSDYYDASLAADECLKKIEGEKGGEVYDAVVIDEVQDLTRSMLLLILKSLKDNFLLCGDVNQVIHPSFFSASKLRDFLCKDILNKGTELKVCILEKNYRNSQKVIELANRILHLKNYCFASEDTITEEERKCFFMKSETDNAGSVGLIAENKEIAKSVSRSTCYAVLVLDDSYKLKAKKSFDTPLIFNIQEAKGLEFENVILYKFEEAYCKIWSIVCPNKGRTSGTIAEIRSSYHEGNVNTSRPKDKKDKSFEEHKFYVNALYVGVTRAIDNVYIIGDVAQHNLLKVVVPGEEVGVVDTASIEKKESSPEEWRDMALNLINKGNIEQAKDISKKLSNKEEYVHEIMDALKAQGWNKKAEEIMSTLNQATPEKTRLQFPQSSATDGTMPEGSKKQVRKRKKKRNPAQNQNDGLKKELLQNEDLVGVICNDKINEFQKIDISLYNKQEMLNLASRRRSVYIAHHLLKDPTLKLDNNLIKNIVFVKLAIQKGNKDMVKLLLDRGANVNDEDTDGCTALFEAVQCGLKDIVQLLLDRGADVNIKAKGKVDVVAKEFAPLHVAARRGNKEIVEILLGNGAEINVKDMNGFTPLHIAVQNNYCDIVKILLDYGADVNVQLTNGSTPLYLAAAGGHAEIAKILVGKEADLKTGVKSGFTPLHIASQNGHGQVAKILLDRGVDVNAETKEGATSLHMAAGVGHKGVVEILLDKGANVNSEGKKGFPPLHMATSTGHRDIAELLLNYGADVNSKAKAEENRTPLHLAADHGYKNVAQLLLNRGANINAKDKKGFTPVDIAVKNGYGGIVDILLKGKTVVDVKTKEYTNSLLIAAGGGDKSMVEVLLDKGADINAKTKEEGATPLYVAVQEGYKDIVELLLDRGADVQTRTKGGLTPLHVAISQSFPDIAKILLNNGADVNAKDKKEGFSPLYMAAANGNKEIVEILLGKGADVSVKTEEGLMPLYISVQKGHTDVAKLLLDCGADVNAKNRGGFTALYMAAELGHKDIVGILLGRGADVNATTTGSCSPLFMAALNGHKEVVEILLDHGADVCVKTEEIGGTPLHAAVQGGHKDITKLLLVKGADVNAMAEGNFTALYSAVLYGHKEVVETLLNCGADVNVKAKGGFTPLYMAALYGNKEVVKLLLDRGADVNANTEDGATPLYVALEEGHKDVAEILSNKGAAPYIKGITGKSHLHAAIWNGDTHFVNILLKNGADVTQLANENGSPFYLAVSLGNKEMIDVLLGHVSRNKLNGFVNAKNSSTGMTALHMAVVFGFSEVVKSLLKHGAIYNIQDNHGNTPILCHRDYDTPQNLLKLVEELFEDAEKGNVKIIKKLNAVTPDEFLAVTNARNVEGNTLLQVAIVNKHKNIAGKLLEMLKKSG